MENRYKFEIYAKRRLTEIWLHRPRLGRPRAAVANVFVSCEMPPSATRTIRRMFLWGPDSSSALVWPYMLRKISISVFSDTYRGFEPKPGGKKCYSIIVVAI